MRLSIIHLLDSAGYSYHSYHILLPLILLLDSAGVMIIWWEADSIDQDELYYTSANGQFSVSKRLKNGYKWFTSFLIHFASSFYSSAMSLSTALLDQAFEHAQLGSEGDCDPPSIERIDSLLNTSSCPSPSLSSSDLNHTHCRPTRWIWGWSCSCYASRLKAVQW
jgi:hypothetical protein